MDIKVTCDGTIFGGSIIDKATGREVRATRLEIILDAETEENIFLLTVVPDSVEIEYKKEVIELDSLNGKFGNCVTGVGQTEEKKD